MSKLLNTNTQEQKLKDLDDALASLGIGLKETCQEISLKLFDKGFSCLDDLCHESEQDAREILSNAGLNKIQENNIMTAIHGRTLYAFDCSGSVGSSLNYFPILLRMIDKCPKNSMFICWDDQSSICSLPQIMKWIMSKKGYNGTSPICFIKDIPADFGPNDNLIIVSDGKISSSSVQSVCQAMNSRFHFGKKFKQIQVILINTGGELDKSIVSAFTKYDCQFVLEIYDQNGSLRSREEENFFKLFDKLRDMKNLLEFTPELRKSIHNLALGCSSTDRIVVELRSEIKRLMRKFQEELDRASPSGNLTLDEFTAETGKENPLVSVLERCVKKISSDFHLKKETEGNPLLILIQTESDITYRLLDFGINSGLHNSGSGVSGLAVANASVAEEVNIDTCAMADSCNFDGLNLKSCSFDFEDPISGEVTIGCVPIVKGDSLLPLGNLSQMRKFPMLLVVNDGIFMTPIGLDGFFGIVQHSLSSGLNLSHPLTRAPMRDTAFLIFPKKATDEQKVSIVEFNNSVIAKLLFDGKKIGDTNLFYFCFALRMLSVSFLQEFKPQIEEEIQWRLKNSMTCATLCGPSTEFPHNKMSILNALIFTVLSASVCETSAQNPLLMHISYLPKFKKLLEISGVKLPDEINKHNELIQVAMKLLSINKENQSKNGGKMRLLGYRNLVGWKLITVNGSFYPTGVRLDEEEQLEQNEIFKEILQQIVGFPIEIDLFCSLYDLFINQNDFLKIPHIPSGLPIYVSPRNFILFKSTDEDFRKAVVDYIKGRKFDKLPSFDYMCSKLYITKPDRLLTSHVWDELVAGELDTDEKIASFYETYKLVPKYVSGGGGSRGEPRTQHSSRFGRKTRRRWLGLSKSEQKAICNGE